MLNVGQSRRTVKDSNRAGAASWVFRYALNGKTREMGFGSYPTITGGIQEAGKGGAGTIGADWTHWNSRDTERARKAEGKAALPFKECALAHIDAKRPGWTNDKHGEQWTSTLETYAFPICWRCTGCRFGHHRDHLVRILEPIWLSKNQDGQPRVRQRRGKGVLDLGKSQGVP